MNAFIQKINIDFLKFENKNTVAVGVTFHLENQVRQKKKKKFKYHSYNNAEMWVHICVIIHQLI